VPASEPRGARAPWACMTPRSLAVRVNSLRTELRRTKRKLTASVVADRLRQSRTELNEGTSQVLGDVFDAVASNPILQELMEQKAAEYGDDPDVGRLVDESESSGESLGDEVSSSQLHRTGLPRRTNAPTTRPLLTRRLPPDDTTDARGSQPFPR